MQSKEQEETLDIDLGQVVVRPVFQGERERFKHLLAAHHYLGSPAMIGQTIQYVALYKERWVGLLVFSAAALKSRPRDKWIGWAACFQWQRLHLIANNTRFLILPDCSKKNLASKVLSICARRISRDWQVLHSHPLLLLETFVDPILFKGTCYLASGWKELGITKGFRKSNTRYVQHGRPKKILIKSLHSNSREILRHPILCETYRKGEVPQMKLNQKQADSLFDHIALLTDPRSFQGQRHNKRPLVAIAVCATLCGAKGYEAISDWAKNLSQAMRRRLKCTMKNGKFIVPGKTTIYRFLVAIDPEELDKIFSMWIGSLGGDDPGIAIDGKTMRGTSKNRADQTHVLSAVTHRQGLHIAQKKLTRRAMRSSTSARY